MQSNNFRNKEIVNMPLDLEGITRPEKDKKTKKFTFLVQGLGIGTAPMRISINAENKVKAVKYIKARWKDCKLKLV
tara:strand:+ start:2202 stop:2429 length:228 start_codon:yes stop_codon:yes gene_type:complete